MNSTFQVVTVSEAAKMFNVSPGTIRYHLDRGNLTFRKTDRVHLICIDSLIALYGFPKTVATYLQSAS